MFNINSYAAPIDRVSNEAQDQQDKQLNKEIGKKKEDAIKKFLDKVNELRKQGTSDAEILRWPVEIGCQHMIALLLKQEGINVNARGENGRTALHWAVEKGNKDVCRLLLENDAAVNQEDDSRLTPLKLASDLALWSEEPMKASKQDIAKLLWEHAFQNKEANYGGFTRLLCEMFKK